MEQELSKMFEAWQERTYPCLEDDAFDKSEDEPDEIIYESAATQACWQSWKAGRESNQS